MSYPEVYILGRQVDGVYVEYSEPYLSKIEAELDKRRLQEKAIANGTQNSKK